MQTNNIVANCMLWLTDISTYRQRVQKMQQKLQSLKNQFSLQGKFEKYISLSRELQGALKKLNTIESKVIHTVNMHEDELYLPSLTKMPAFKSENDLYDHMIYANKIIVELQRAVDNCFEETAVPEKRSLLIEMPVTKKIKHQQA